MSILEDGAHPSATAPHGVRRLPERPHAIGDVGSWSWNLETGAVSWSVQLFGLHGLDPAGPVPDREQFLALVHPGDRARVARVMSACVRARGAFRDEYRVIREGRVLTLQVDGDFMAADERCGLPARLVGLIRDLGAEHAELAERERARLEAEERLLVTVEHAPIGIGLVELGEDGGGRLLSANEALCGLLGDPDPVGGGLRLTSLLHPEDAAALREALTVLSADRRARVELEVRCLHGDGTIVWLQVVGAAVPAPVAGHPAPAVLHVVDIGERKRFEGQLQHLSDHDALTGLPNRGRFEAELERAVAHAARYGSRAGVMLIDLDGFKYVNDTMGHSHGDELVARIGGVLRGTLRETDVVARVGGDEFAVIVTQADEAQTRLVAEKVLGALRESGIVLSENRHARVTASIGLTTFDGDTSLTPEELVVEADIAMYQAKEEGKDRVISYRRGDEHRSRVAKRESWLARLRQATENEGFELLAQPITGICAQDIPRFELLLRLRSDDGDLIPPGSFLANAERYDLVQSIDRWVFGQALELLRAHHAAGNDISLSVNMSGRTLNDPELLEDLAAMLEQCPIPRDRLIVEVTETAAITNIERAGHVARGLRELGCQFALDDFGAGFASFYYLKHLEFDFLKIDGEFVRSLTRNITDQLVIKSVVDIARGLGAKTIAEFVGDDDAVRRLRELGVDYGQGYHLGRPGRLGQRLPSLDASLTSADSGDPSRPGGPAGPGRPGEPGVLHD